MFVTDQERLKQDIARWVEYFGHNRSSLIPILQEIQKKHHRVSNVAMQVVADHLGIHPVEVHGVVSFYSFLDERPKGRFVVRVCRTICCDIAGKQRIAQQLMNDLEIPFGHTTRDGKFSLEWANCIGMCDQGPALLINDEVYTRVTAAMVHDIIDMCRRTFGVHALDAHQGGIRVIPSNYTGNLTFSTVSPEDGLAAALEKPRPDLIADISASQLKGRGGAGFPTGVKWNLAAAANGEVKYVICNADEGEPGTFKDRLILSEHADLVFAGMTMAGYAIGATIGIVYLRGEYAYLRQHLEQVLARRREKGLLGKNVAGRSGFDFDIEIRMGSGAYVCGEETALIESLEGHRGEPRNRPPFPADTGFNGRPSIVNNVETFVWVTCICAKGVEWFKSIGTPRSAGPKLLSVSGDCANPGVYEFPLGTAIAAVLDAAGATDARAVQIGGASGVCVPATEFHRTIAFEDLPTGGSFIVFGRHRNMLDVARNFLEFFTEESCGQCTPCREGIPKLLDGVERMARGTCSTRYLNEMCMLGETMQLASKCGLGQSAPNAFLSIVKHFSDDVTGRYPGAEIRDTALLQDK